MQTEERMRELNADIDRLLCQPDTVTKRGDREYDEMLEVAQVLATADVSALSQKQQATRYRLLHPATPRHSLGLRARPALTGALIVLALLVVVITVPPLRVMAQDVIDSIGRLFLTRQPTAAEQEFASEELRFEDMVPEPLTLTQAQERVDFPIRLPSYLPEGVALHNVTVTEEQDSVVVTLTYGGPYLLTIEQMDLREEGTFTLPLGDAVIPQPVMVGEVDGVWLEHVPAGIGGLASEEQPEVFAHRLLFYENILTWEEEGRIYVISTNSSKPPESDGLIVTLEEPALSLAEVVRIGESLQAPE